MIRPEVVFKNIYQASASPAQSVEWTVNGDLPYFNGHFPQNPILPAIAIVDASTYLLQRALNQPQLKVKTISVAKFLSPIVPGQTVHISWQKHGEQEWQIEWKENSASGSRLLATLRVQL